jgi:hypothetical protein
MTKPDEIAPWQREAIDKLVAIQKENPGQEIVVYFPRMTGLSTFLRLLKKYEALFNGLRRP